MTGIHKLSVALDAAVKAVCPITGIAIGRRGDRSSWKFRPTPEATPAQRRAAQSVIDAFVDNFTDDTLERDEEIEMRLRALEARGAP